MPNQSINSIDSEDHPALYRLSTNIDEEAVRLILSTREHGEDRLLKVPTSVILPKSGKKVKRSNLFFKSDVDESSDECSSAYERTSSNGDQELDETVFGRLCDLRLKIAELAESATFQNVVKASVAYLIASLAVYWGPLSHFLGNLDTKHIAASASVYFHPGKSKGAMHQLFLFALLSLLFSFSLSLSSRTISSFLYNKGMIGWSYAIDLLLSSIGLGIVAYWKQKVDMDSFSTACHLAYISIIAGIVKEGSLNADRSPLPGLIALSKIVMFGSLTAVCVCYLLWPRSAVALLRSSLNDSFNNMSLLLSVLSHRFLKGEAVIEKDEKLLLFLHERTDLLKVYLKEAQFELRLSGKEAEYELYKEIVNATCSLEEHLQGIKSSCEMQWHLLQSDVLDPDYRQQLNSDCSARFTRKYSRDIADEFIRFQNHAVEDSGAFDAVYSTHLFDLFAYYLAPSVKSFVFTVKEILGVLPFEELDGKKKRKHKFVDSANYQTSLEKALDIYEEKQVRTFESLYSQQIFQPDSFIFKSDQEEVAACCGNFSALLGSYGKELIRFLELIAKFEEVAKSKRRSWTWLTSWRSFSRMQIAKKDSDSTLVDALQEITARAKRRYDVSLQDYCFETTALLPKKRTRCDQLRSWLWENLRILRSSNFQFGLRTAIGAFFISIFAFVPATRSRFVSYRSEWALIIYCIMMSKSLGGTAMPAKWRFMGTFQGALLAYIIWHVSNANPIALALTGFCLSIPCFYILIYWEINHAYGRFILLTYNLTALYTYMELDSLGDGDKRPIVWEIAFHRFVAVSFGIIWALLITAILLPNSARTQLKSGLTILWLRMGVIWSSNPMDSRKYHEGHRLVGMRDLKGTREVLLECHTLLKLAPNEFRLRGRFPKNIYAQLLTCTSAVLDAFLNLQIMVRMNSVLLPNELYVLQYIEEERDELEHRIFLIFYMISSALALGFPLPSKPASTEHAKNRLLLKLSEFRTESRQNQIKLSNKDYCRLYSYILVTSVITNELDKILELNSALLGHITEDIFRLV